MAYFRCIGNKSSPTPGPTGYDYYVENIDLKRNSYLITDQEIFSSTNRTRSYQIDFKMLVEQASEAPFIGTNSNVTECNLEIFNTGSTSYIYLKKYTGSSGTALSQNIDNKDVTILYDGTTGTFTFKIDGTTIDTFTFSSLPSSTYNPSYLNVGRYVGGSTYYFNGYCYYFGFKWLS